MTKLPLDQIQQLPLTNRVTVPADYLDVMGHMNVQYYVSIADRGTWTLFNSFGLDVPYFEATNTGSFALRQFINYLAEVRVNQTVAVYSRVLGRSAKRLHFMHFMVNETAGTLACTVELLGSFMDLSIRRTAPWPDEIAARLDEIINEHEKLAWSAPVSGAINP